MRVKKSCSSGYKKLLEEQINVIDSKQNIAKDLKELS